MNEHPKGQEEVFGFFGQLMQLTNGQIVEGVDYFHPEHLADAFWA